MAERFESEELDDDTLAYLRKAARREGSAMPGVYFDAKEAKLWSATLPIWAAVCGLILLPLTFLLGWGATSDPPGTAMFLTAGIVLGGWMIVAAVRVRIARARSDWLGSFTYIDPLYIWNTTGSGLWATPIDLLVSAACHHHCDENGNYKHSTVTITLADKPHTLLFRSEHKAERLALFLEELTEIREGDPTERGYAALEAVAPGEEEHEENRRVTGIPRPVKVRGSLDWLPILLWLVAGVGVFFLSLVLATRRRDDAICDLVKDKQEPGELRYYLIDKRNTRHREEVTAKLRALMEREALRVESQGNETLGAALAEIVRAVAAEPSPLVTIRFPRQEKRPDTVAGYLSDAVTATMNRELVKEITDRLSQHLGQQTADYAEATDPPAMIEFVPKVTAPAKGAVGHQVVRIEWVVTFQASPEAKKHTLTIHGEMARNGDDSGPAVRSLYRQLGAAFNALLTRQK